MGGPRSTGGWSRGSVEPSTLSGMAGGSGLGLAAGNEPRTLVRHVIQRPSYDGGNAATQRRMSHTNELRHSGPVRAGTARNGIETVTKYNWWRFIPGSGSGDGGTRGTLTSSLGPNGGIRTVETYDGPITVRDSTILNTSCKEYAVKS